MKNRVRERSRLLVVREISQPFFAAADIDRYAPVRMKQVDRMPCIPMRTNISIKKIIRKIQFMCKARARACPFYTHIQLWEFFCSRIASAGLRLLHARRSHVNYIPSANISSSPYIQYMLDEYGQ